VNGSINDVEKLFDTGDKYRIFTDSLGIFGTTQEQVHDFLHELIVYHEYKIFVASGMEYTKITRNTLMLLWDFQRLEVIPPNSVVAA
jgi:hypothetical protein